MTTTAPTKGTENDIVEILQMARSYFNQPHIWTQWALGGAVAHRRRTWRSLSQVTAWDAINKAAWELNIHSDTADLAHRALTAAVECEDASCFVDWHSAPERTMQDVIAAFDRAILTPI